MRFRIAETLVVLHAHQMKCLRQVDRRAARSRRLVGSTLLLLAVVGLVWEGAGLLLIATHVGLARSKLPPFHEVAGRIIDEAPLLSTSVWVTARGALIGLACGTALGVLVALFIAQARWLEDAVYPYIIGGQMIPTIALAPVLLIALRNATATRILVATYITFFAVSVATLKGLKSTSPDAVELMRSYNASRFEMYRKLRFPSALPYFFAGLKIAAPLSVVGEIVVELTGANSGIGYTILVSTYYGPAFATLFWAALVLTLLLGALFYLGSVRLERLVSPWQHEFRAEHQSLLAP